jgi:hypothetical protein
MKRMSHIVVFWIVMLSGIASVQAQQDAVEMAKPYVKFGDNTVHFNLFSSTMLTPSTAKATGFTRADDIILLNIALVKGAAHSGSPATVVGHYKNLLQQQRDLEFREINETDATYYLAAFRVTDEDILHFSIEVTPIGSEQSHTVEFSRKMYTDQ